MALKALTLALIIYYTRLESGFWMIFLAGALLWFYFRPPMDLQKFLTSFFVLTISLILFPKFISGFVSGFIAVFYAAAFSLLVGVKNLVFLRRDVLYYIVYAAGIGSLSALYFYIRLGSSIFAQIGLFIAVFFLSKEFFWILGNEKNKILPAATALISIELLWVVSILPIWHFSKVIFGILGIFLFSDFLLNRLLRMV